jgi:ligand-binding sensor domain-containing protein
MRRTHLAFAIPFAVVLAARLPSAAGPAPGESRPFHLGHYGDVRALCRAGDSLWVGTGGGVFIYDLGSSEMTGHMTISKGLPSNSVRAISARDGDVYVGTDDGLSVFAPGSEEVYTDAAPRKFSGCPFGLIRRIDFGLDGLVYLSTYGRGLGVLGGESGWVITREDSLLDDKVFGMVQEDDTTFYFATSTGLCAFRDSLWVSFRAGAGIPRAEIRQILAAPDGGYYLVVGKRGVYWFDGERAKRITSPSLFEENAVAAIAVDAAGGLWACGSHGGVAVYRNGHWTSFGSPGDDYGHRRWKCAAADTLGGVFFGSADGSVLWIRDDVATDIRLPDGLPAGAVLEMTADSSGAVYALNGSYLVRFDRDTDTFTLEQASPVVVGFAVSPQGQLWTVTRWGVYRRDGGRYLPIDARLSERQPVFSAIGFDDEGYLWVGTQAGNVYRFDGTVWMRLADAGDVNLGAVRGFDVDGGGRVWTTGSNGAVAVYHYGRWTRFEPPAYGDLPARCIAVAPSGIPVLATDGGLWGYNGEGDWKAVEFVRSGSGADTSAAAAWDPDSPPILTLAFDPAGRLYVGTEDGIAAIDGSGMRWITRHDDIGGVAVTSLFVSGVDTRGFEDLWIGFRSDGLTRLGVAVGAQEAIRD